MEYGGLAMLALAGAGLLGTGLPVWSVLIGVSVLAAAVGILGGGIDPALLTALPGRIVGLLENDLLQALPLYVLMGVLLHRLPLANTLIDAGTRLARRSPAAPLLAALGLGALLAPMNGSVGASVATLSRLVYPRLNRSGVAPASGVAVVCVASTLGVVVPPSLVLILLGDAMMRAHTEALQATRRMAQIVNTQDIFRGALVPAAIFLAASLAIVWYRGRRAPPLTPPPAPLPPATWATAAVTVAAIVGLLAGVALGYLYAVEAAALGALGLIVAGLTQGLARRETVDAILQDTMAISGALFALFVGATTFTLVFRALGTDRLLDRIVSALPFGATGAVVGVLAMIGGCAIVLDAFEIIFVVVPVLMPPLLMRVDDAVWVSVLALLVLQSAFLLPPFGYAVLMARSAVGQWVSTAATIRAVTPFLAAQLAILGLAIAFPQIVHWAEPPTPPAAPAVDGGAALEALPVPDYLPEGTGN